MDAMKPNSNAIYSLIEAWSTGVLSYEETFERLEKLMSPKHFVPVSALAPIGNVAVESRSDDILTIVRRIEIRLTVLANELNMPLPDELNPKVGFSMTPESYWTLETRSKPSTYIAAVLVAAWRRPTEPAKSIFVNVTAHRVPVAIHPAKRGILCVINAIWRLAFD